MAELERKKKERKGKVELIAISILIIRPSYGRRFNLRGQYFTLAQLKTNTICLFGGQHTQKIRVYFVCII